MNHGRVEYHPILVERLAICKSKSENKKSAE